MRGFLDGISADRREVSGWVEAHDPSDPPQLAVLLDGVATGTVVMGLKRDDVELATGLSNARFAIRFELPLHLTALVARDLDVRVLDSSGSKTSAGAESTSSPLLLSAGIRLAESRKLNQVPNVKAISNGNACPADPSALSYIGFPVGLASPDGSAMLGTNGHLFLVEGSNRLSELYRKPQTLSEIVALNTASEHWIRIAEERRARFNAMNCGFLQVIIPEKSTVLCRYLPGVDEPTALLSSVDSGLSRHSWYVSGLRVFDEWTGRLDPWQKLDSHCSPAGSFALVNAILDALPGVSFVLPDIAMDYPVSYQGDLSSRFLRMDLWDFSMEPSPGLFGAAEASAKLTETVTPPDGGHLGLREVWHNEAAPIDKTVVVFGNSFFATGEYGPSKLSWWFARLFRDFHFIWSPDIDDAYVESIGPDFVIGQTIERFLNRLPQC